MYALLSNTSFVDLPAGNNVYPSKTTKSRYGKYNTAMSELQHGWLPGWQWTGTLNFQYFSAHPDSYRNHEVHPDSGML
jgi:hypothetical protein